MEKVEEEIKGIFDAVEPFLNKKEKDVFWVLRYRSLNPLVCSRILGIPRTTFISRKDRLFIKLRSLIVEHFGEKKVGEINEKFFNNSGNV